MKKLEPPHTSDEILSQHRFTNAYRAADRVSQFLIRHVLYRGDPNPTEVVFRSLLFRTFNRIETWKYLSGAFGEIRYCEFTAERYARVLDEAFARGEKIYSSAYIMPSQSKKFCDRRKHRNHLNLISYMMRDNLTGRLEGTRTLSDVFDLFLKYPMFGPFLAFQFAIDINYSAILDFSEMDFVVAGPGARSGIRKCFGASTGITDADLIRYVTDRQEIDSRTFGEEFESLWGRPLQLIDVQNLFCEVDKYARIAHPDVLGIGGRTRIKRLYRPCENPIDYWFPPKWQLNAMVAAVDLAAA